MFTFIRPSCLFSERGRGNPYYGCAEIARMPCNYTTFSVRSPRIVRSRRRSCAKAVQNSFGFQCLPKYCVCCSISARFSQNNRTEIVQCSLRHVYGLPVTMFENVFDFQLNKIVENTEPVILKTSQSPPVTARKSRYDQVTGSGGTSQTKCKLGFSYA